MFLIQLLIAGNETTRNLISVASSRSLSVRLSGSPCGTTVH